MALIVLIFYLVLRAFFFRPILKVMAERETRTIGAQKAAEAAQAAATERVKQYQEALKHAQAKVYQEQEAERKKLLDERAAMLKETRTKATEEVGMAKGRVALVIAALILSAFLRKTGGNTFAKTQYSNPATSRKCIHLKMI